jgi:hypothetical protein
MKKIGVDVGFGYSFQSPEGDSCLFYLPLGEPSTEMDGPMGFIPPKGILCFDTRARGRSGFRFLGCPGVVSVPRGGFVPFLPRSIPLTLTRRAPWSLTGFSPPKGILSFDTHWAGHPDEIIAIPNGADRVSVPRRGFSAVIHAQPLNCKLPVLCLKEFQSPEGDSLL